MTTPEVIPSNTLTTLKKKHPIVFIVVGVAVFLAIIDWDVTSHRFDLAMVHVGLLSFALTARFYQRRLELKWRWLYRACAIVGIVSFASSVIFIAMR